MRLGPAGHALVDNGRDLSDICTSDRFRLIMSSVWSSDGFGQGANGGYCHVDDLGDLLDLGMARDTLINHRRDLSDISAGDSLSLVVSGVRSSDSFGQGADCCDGNVHDLGDFLNLGMTWNALINHRWDLGHIGAGNRLCLISSGVRSGDSLGLGANRGYRHVYCFCDLLNLSMAGDTLVYHCRNLSDIGAGHRLRFVVRSMRASDSLGDGTDSSYGLIHGFRNLLDLGMAGHTLINDGRDLGYVGAGDGLGFIASGMRSSNGLRLGANRSDSDIDRLGDGMDLGLAWNSLVDGCGNSSSDSLGPGLCNTVGGSWPTDGYGGGTESCVGEVDIFGDWEGLSRPWNCRVLLIARIAAIDGAS